MIVGLDLATKTGIAWWKPTYAKPRSMVLELPKGEYEDGRAYVKLHKALIELHRTEGEVEAVYFEKPSIPGNMQGGTNMRAIWRLFGLVAHAESFAYAMGAQCYYVEMSSWRRHFLGKGAGENRAAFKAASKNRCRQLGWEVKDDNAADACGVLDYGIHCRGIHPPWRDDMMMLPAVIGVGVTR